jgi:hypothetical protein
VLKEEKLDATGARLETSLRKCIKQLAQEMKVLKTFAVKL